MTEQNTALIVFEKDIVTSTKVDQVVWQLQQVDAQLAPLLSQYMLLSVTDNETKVKAEQGIMAFRKARKAWDAGRKEWGSPLDRVKRTVDAAYRERDRPAGEQEDRLIREVQDYTRKLEQERMQREAEARRVAEEANRALREKAEAEEKAAREKAAAEKVEYVAPPVVGIPEVIVKAEPVEEIPTAEGLGYVRRWKYIVEDISKVPDAYTRKVIDDEAVMNAIRAATTIPAGQKMTQCTASIPGINIYHEDRPRM